ncbi:hypothetical protein SETIT_4G145100v2 [Setaria italica]|uniref:MLLE-like domain-containing protein n=1 Tax=Setaria italica TaxID=4555 RepID=A0A368QW47_SETIT|nr:hypothetical protein SETIT_4G145100v2 [Setaria italica]
MDLSESSTTTIRGRGKNKRKWTVAEDDELGEGGFKNGYCSVLETHLAEKLPNCGIPAVPHIESRVRHFRTKFGALEVMLNKSGFNWDENRKMLQCMSKLYFNVGISFQLAMQHSVSIAKYHPEAKGLYGVAFPYYDSLAAVYGSDIATGEGAEGLSEAVENIEKELAVEGGNHQEEEEDRMSRETPRRSTDSASSSLKRRKTDRKGKDHVSATSSDPILDMLHEVQGDLKGVSTNIGKMAAVMEREDHQQKLREKATAELRKLGFTGSEQVKAASVFVRIPDQMSMLLTLDETLRREFILNMLANPLCSLIGYVDSLSIVQQIFVKSLSIFLSIH